MRSAPCLCSPTSIRERPRVSAAVDVDLASRDPGSPGGFPDVIEGGTTPGLAPLADLGISTPGLSSPGPTRAAGAAPWAVAAWRRLVTPTARTRPGVWTGAATVGAASAARALAWPRRRPGRRWSRPGRTTADEDWCPWDPPLPWCLWSRHHPPASQPSAHVPPGIAHQRPRSRRPPRRQPYRSARATRRRRAARSRVRIRPWRTRRTVVQRRRGGRDSKGGQRASEGPCSGGIDLLIQSKGAP